MDSLGKTLIALVVIITVIGLIMHFGTKFLNFGRRFGDFYYQKEHFSFHFPIVTCLVISILMTIIINLFMRK